MYVFNTGSGSRTMHAYAFDLAFMEREQNVMLPLHNGRGEKKKIFFPIFFLFFLFIYYLFKCKLKYRLTEVCVL